MTETADPQATLSPAVAGPPARAVVALVPETGAAGPGVEFARALAGALHASLVVAATFRYEPQSFSARAGAGAENHEREQAALRRAEAVVQACGCADASVEAVADDPTSPVAAVGGLVHHHGAGIVVVDVDTLPERPGLARALLHHARCPVLVTHGDRTPLARGAARIGVALDGGAGGERALAVAASLAPALDGRLSLLRVVDPHHPRLVALADPLGVRDAYGVSDGMARTALLGAAGLTRTQAPAVPVETQVLHGGAAEALVARSADLDLLVCGSHGRGRTAEKIFGSVSARLARDAACPVLLVPPDPVLPA